MKQVPTITLNGREIVLALARSTVETLKKLAEKNQWALSEFIKKCHHDSEYKLSPEDEKTLNDYLLLEADGEIHPDIKTITGVVMRLVNGKIIINDLSQQK